MYSDADSQAETGQPRRFHNRFPVDSWQTVELIEEMRQTKPDREFAALSFFALFGNRGARNRVYVFSGSDFSGPQSGDEPRGGVALNGDAS